jgi:hypothetical protein
MPFQVMQNWGKWAEGAIISGGDIAEYRGREAISEADRIKLGLPEASGIPEERIRELIKRGILRGIGDDATFQPDTPLILQPTFEERQAILSDYNRNPLLT